MTETLSPHLLELKELTLKIKELFSSNTTNNVKWLFLDTYTTKYLRNKPLSTDVSGSYCTIASTLIDFLDPYLFTTKKEEIIFDECILSGVPHDVILIIFNKLEKSGQEFKLKKLITLLRKFFESGKLEILLCNQSVSEGDWNIKYVSASNVWNNLATYLVSLPERVANRSPGHNIKMFYPETYVHLVISSIFKTLHHVYQLDEESNDYSFKFLGILIGRLCNSGYGDIFAKRLCGSFINCCESNLSWRHFMHNLISSVQPIALESFLIHLLLVIPWFGYVEWFLDDGGVKNERICHLMKTKLLFIRHFENDVILQNIIGYFASSPGRSNHFKQLIKSLIDSWASINSYNQQSFQQKFYVSSALMICCGWLKRMKIESLPTGCMDKILHGVQIRLQCVEERERYMGMVVGQNLIAALDPSAPSLNFDYEGKAAETVDRLIDLMEVKEKPEKDYLCLFEEDLKCFEEISVEKTDFNDEKKPAKSELDSDDDLEPYDLSNDSSSNSEDKHPLYLAECMKGLIEQEDASWTEQCLIHAEKLIKDKSSVTHEVAVEFAKVLLHMDDKFDTPNFSTLKHKSLVALTVDNPFEVPKYLASQFHAKDYTISQRLDVLDALGAASQILSEQKYEIAKIESSSKQYQPLKQKEWQSIIERRLEAKTKRFFKVPRKANLPVSSQNKFLPVAGNFFFPLLNLNSKEKLPYFLEEDSFLLGRFIYTLGLIVLNAANNIQCQAMGTDLLLFISSKKKHVDMFVRQSIIYSTAAVFLSVPNFMLLTDMLPHVNKAYEWLEDVVKNDPDVQCKERALHALDVFHSIAQEESPSILPK